MKTNLLTEMPAIEATHYRLHKIYDNIVHNVYNLNKKLLCEIVNGNVFL